MSPGEVRGVWREISGAKEYGSVRHLQPEKTSHSWGRRENKLAMILSGFGWEMGGFVGKS